MGGGGGVRYEIPGGWGGLKGKNIKRKVQS